MEVTATAKYVRVSPRKLRLVLDTVRGKKVDEALTLLKFIPNSAASMIATVVKSAAANAENNFQMEPADLRIVRTYAGEGRRLKRFRAAARGRAARRVHRTSHITVVVEEQEAS
ncbi:MAG: 50S ribosomal protein L22 [Chloroflexi bacterium]|nr:50S ribosomal protein L22 [Chloroflexota bacterium]